MTYCIEIRETLSRIVELEADDLDEALMAVRQQYRDEDIVLTENDYVGTEFIPIETLQK